MEGKKDEHQSIFTTILEDQNNDVPKFLDEVVEFVHSKTKYRGYGHNTIKELFSESVEKHFNTKFVALKRKSTNDSSENIADEDKSDNKSKIAHGAVKKLRDEPKIKFIDPKKSKFWKK